MILAITPNPALDRTVIVAGLTLGSVHVAAAGHQKAGGKGLNVARAVRSLGGDVIAAGPIGGVAGVSIDALATDEGLRTLFTRISGESRTCTILTDGVGTSTVVNEPGPDVSEPEWRRFVGDVASAAADSQLVTISGSLPPSAAPGSLASLSEVCPQDDEYVWIDCDPKWMDEALRSGRSIKVNHHEAAGSLGIATPASDRVSWAADAARSLVERGASQCIVTLGSRGAVWATSDTVLVGESPTVDTVNAVGSGDSFLAGIAVSIERGASRQSALAVALAAGAANAMQPVAGLLDPSIVKELAASISVR